MITGRAQELRLDLDDAGMLEPSPAVIELQRTLSNELWVELRSQCKPTKYELEHLLRRLLITPEIFAAVYAAIGPAAITG